MTRKNYIGLLGTSYLRDSRGNPSSTSVSAFWHPLNIKYSLLSDNEGVIISLKSWETKTKFKNKEPHNTNQFSQENRIQYVVDENFTVKKANEKFDGDGTTTDFNFTKSIDSESLVLVQVDGVKLILEKDYTVSFDSGDSGTSTISIFYAPPTGTKNVVITRLIKGLDYFTESKLVSLPEGSWIGDQILEFLGDLDGDDQGDYNGIDFKSHTKDKVE